jgi:hypothetical protein
MITEQELVNQAYELCLTIRNTIHQEIFDKDLNDVEKLLRIQQKAFKRYMRRRNNAEKFIEF